MQIIEDVCYSHVSPLRPVGVAGGC